MNGFDASSAYNHPVTFIYTTPLEFSLHRINHKKVFSFDVTFYFLFAFLADTNVN